MRLKLSSIAAVLALPIVCSADNEASASTENEAFHNLIDSAIVEASLNPYKSAPAEQKEVANWYTPKCDSDEAVAPPVQATAPSSRDHRIQLGGNYTYAWISPSGNNTTNGSLGGAQGIYEYRPFAAVYTGAAFNYRIGKTTHHSTTRKLQDFNTQARVGYTCPKNEIIDRVTFFTGFGGRYMPETVEVGSASLDFNYTTFYIPVGFLLEKQVVDHFLIGCNFQWMPQVLPMVRIDLLDGAQWDTTYQLVNFFVEVPFIFSMCEDLYSISISPFFECWRDGKTTAETLTHLTLALPGNQYLFTGVNVNFGFNF